MGLFTTNYYWWRVSCNCLSSKTHLKGWQPFALNFGVYDLSSQLHHVVVLFAAKVKRMPYHRGEVAYIDPLSCLGGRFFRGIGGYGARVVAFATRKSAKKVKRNKEKQNDLILESSKNQFDDYNAMREDSSSGDDTNRDDFTSVVEGNSISIPSRNTVLQACSVTSGLMAFLGLTMRKVSEVASSGGLPVFDCSVVSFGFEVWHLELITGLVVAISMSRYILLNIWPDFAESSEAANRQVLTSLETLDYVVVALLSGVSEELLFRGGLLPLIGLNWKGALAVAVLFGVLHLGSGRKFSFAVWATFVGLAYGYATIVSSSMVVPMASHTLNNLAGALLWRFTSRSIEETRS